MALEGKRRFLKKANDMAVQNCEYERVRSLPEA